MHTDVYRSERDEACRKSCSTAVAFWIAVGVMTLIYVQVSFSPGLTLFRTNKAKFVETGEFVLAFKTLYVFSKLRNDVVPDLNSTVSATSTNTPSTTRISPKYANSTLSESTNKDTFGVRKELCASTANDIKNLFHCSELQPSSDNVFFVETSCATNQAARMTLPLTEKQSCAIYSAANYNPSRNVILLFTCAVPDGYDWTKEWTVLFDLPNFFFGRVVLKDLYENTSLSGLYQGALSRSKYAVSHNSDLLRQFILYMYGGTYMDLDVISFKSFDALGTNYVIHQSDDYITAGVWQLQPNHQLLLQVMRNAVKRYQPSKFSIIGPELFTDMVKSLCNIYGELDPKKFMNLPSCNLRVLPAYTFFSVHYLSFEEFYDCRFWSHMESLTRVSFGVHYWNQAPMMRKPGVKFVLHIGSKQPLVKFAEKHCPPVYRQAGLTLT